MSASAHLCANAAAPPDLRELEAPGDFQSAMAKAVTEIRSLARSHTRTALNVLVAVMRNTKATPPARVAAANAILDRGWGKPTQSLGNDENALELIHRIERVIVQPDHVDAENPDRESL
jgi:hypothetical protein